MDLSTGVIVPSAGWGRRMGVDTPKQYLPVQGKPVLFYTLYRLSLIKEVCYIVITASEKAIPEVREIADEAVAEAGRHSQLKVDVVAGGKERMDSVGIGLDHLKNRSIRLVMVHDAVRPCFSLEQTEKAIQVAADTGAAILAIPSRDTVKLVGPESVIRATLKREEVWLAQTPQVFQKEVFVKAYSELGAERFHATDDASVVEHSGYPVVVVPGSEDNLKITYLSDLVFFENWLKQHPKANKPE
ncbi:2-C-methyl-D-erythritol 4-phosphate cytidylyltransferase [Balneolaceae bacterium ANBcel3]|nr:2-C-methyl-D-erythritol 4-phosphate cytidylyltransferase [Balneolaceae bacterium ANBcel3]